MTEYQTVLLADARRSAAEIENLPSKFGDILKEAAFIMTDMAAELGRLIGENEKLRAKSDNLHKAVTGARKKGVIR